MYQSKVAPEKINNERRPVSGAATKVKIGIQDVWDFKFFKNFKKHIGYSSVKNGQSEYSSTK